VTASVLRTDGDNRREVGRAALSSAQRPTTCRGLSRPAPTANSLSPSRTHLSGTPAPVSPALHAAFNAIAPKAISTAAASRRSEPTLRVIAQELVTVIKGNVSVDWMHRDSARANIRRHVKRLLRKYGYPPDLQDAAVQNVLQQAEALSADWAA
jgi:type I restriction enzyme R subunit